jgi:ribose-phosphate pyrophosphokinase
MREILFTTDSNPHPQELEIGKYPAGEPFIKSHVVPSRVLLRPKSIETFMAAMFWFDALAWRGHPMPRLILPCVPGARQDRLLWEGDQLFTSKSIAKELNSRNFPQVVVLDPHSNVIAALIDRCLAVSPAHFIPRWKYDAVVTPDAGATSRANDVAKYLGVPTVQGTKKRNPVTGELAGFGIDPEVARYGKLLIVDDLCDGGGTFLGLAKEILSHWSYNTTKTIDLYVTHGYFTQGTGKLSSVFNRIITTDSVLGPRYGVTELAYSTNLLRGF